jgi:hypothetical protein
MTEKISDGRQELSAKKTRKLERHIDMHIKRAYVHGAWGHDWVLAFVTPGDAYLINHKTGVYALAIANGEHVKTNVWRKKGCCA